MPPAAETPDGPLCFGDFVLDVPNARLSRAGELVDLAPKAFALLAYLARRPGELVLKDALLDDVWGRRFVSEGAIKTVVSELRAALGDDARAPQWIETVQRRGYRFIGVLRQAEAQRAVVAHALGAAAAPAPLPPGPGGLAGQAGLVPAGNLPLSLPPTIGRQTEAAALDALLEGHRLVTLTGTAGVGKTRLALDRAAARRSRYPDGVWLIELAPLAAEATDTAALRILLASGLKLAAGAAASSDALARALRPLKLLLVLDNAEHLLEPLAPLLAHLAGQAPGLHLLVTSRELLQLPGEQVLPVPPLRLPRAQDDGDVERLLCCGAVRLFVERVASRQPGFELTPTQCRSVAAVCRALDGLPLALELAAARVPVLGAQGLAEHLLREDPSGGARLRLLTQGARTAAPHQRTLRAALDWSHALLTPGQQCVFRRLAVFRGGFTLQAAQAVCPDALLDPLAVMDALQALVDKSMLVVADQPGGPRFSQLESLHEYALEQLQASGEEAAMRLRHLHALRGYWAQAEAGALNLPAMQWLSAHLPELENLRAALRWAVAAAGDENPGVRDAVVELVGQTASLWPRAGLLAEGALCCGQVRDWADAHPDTLLQAGVDLAQASLCRFGAGPPPAAGLSLARRAAQTFAQHGQATAEYYVHYIAWVLCQEVDPAMDRSLHLRRMQQLLPADSGVLRGRFLRVALSQEARLQGRQDDFLRACRQELALCRDIGAQGEAWSAAAALMLAEHDHGRVPEALGLGEQALDEIRAAGQMRQYAQLLSLHTTMRAEHGDQAGARRALAEALPMLGTMSACEVQLLALAWLACHEGRFLQSARVLGWFGSPQRGGIASYGPGTYTWRSFQALQQRLRGELGKSVLAAETRQGEAMGDEAAVRLGLGG